MKRQEAIDFIRESNSEEFLYGDDGIKVSRDEAIKDIQGMDDLIWNDGNVNPV